MQGFLVRQSGYVDVRGDRAAAIEFGREVAVNIGMSMNHRISVRARLRTIVCNCIGRIRNDTARTTTDIDGIRRVVLQPQNEGPSKHQIIIAKREAGLNVERGSRCRLRTRIAKDRTQLSASIPLRDRRSNENKIQSL